MSQHDQPDQEPQEAAGQFPPTEQTKNANQRRSFANARRELSEEELSTPAVQKLLIDEVERLEADNNELSSYRSRFHTSDKKAAIYEEKHRRVISQEIISNGCLAIGAAALGYLPSLSATPSNAVLCGVIGAVLVIAAIWAKVVRL